MNCLDEDTVLTFVDGKASDDVRVAIAAHLATCASCAELVAASAGSQTEWLPRRALPHALAEAGGLAGGDTVGRYVILNLIGRGGMGEVYAAYDPQLDRRIALKLLHDGVLREGSAQAASKRLLREAKAIARLSHPNVVVVHDAGAIGDAVHGERVFLAMEFIEGETLSSWLGREPRSWRAVRDVFLAAGEGLAAAHEAGLVHRDFKPQNVMVGTDGAVHVMDFGLASDVSAAEGEGAPVSELRQAALAPTPETVALTRTGVLLGTPIYMAPEQFRGQAADARSDQFSFCVALFEALYGERPFPSDSLPQLMDAVLAGRMREPPARLRTARVPSFLRRLLMRGLAAEPAARFSSMGALLGELRADPARRRRRLAAAGVVALTFVAVGAGVHRFGTRGERMCGGAAAKLEGIWEVGDGARRSAVHQAFLATGRDFAEQTWTRVSAMLDDYSRRWTAMYTDSCQATRVRGDQSAEILDLRTNCLEGPRGALGALTDLFTRADGAVLAEAVNAVQALPPLERCSDVVALRAVVPPPAGETRARVAALTPQLAEVKALRDTGQWKRALVQARTLADAAGTVGYEPLLAEVLATRSWLEHESGDSAAAVPTMERAVWMALAAHRDDIAAEMAAQLVAINAYYLGKVDEARRWVKPAEALLARLGPGHERITSWLYQARGGIGERSGEYPAAKAAYDQALAFKLKALPAGHPDVAKTYYSRANVELVLGDAAAALADADKAVAIYRTAYGPDSPLIWNPLDTRGEALNLLHRYGEAEKDFRDAVHRASGLYGEDHAWTAYCLNDLGQVLIGEGRASEAIPVLQKALRARERLGRSPDDTAETRFALARALWTADQDRARAITLATAARDGYRPMPGHERQVAEIEAWLADKADAGAR